MFPAESTAIPFPRSLPLPLILEYPATVPFDPFHLMMNASAPEEAGKLTPDANGAVPNVVIATVVDEV